ncbi:PDZ domain-containing protein [Corynebacterium sp. HMSC071B10]|uniref:YlbL family protein n=1 Tax=Corynebacterium sp. HMSC071B10 TaxID=1739494 RepID=UPI0008A1EF45|nr:PDZ domain-containing protein [Corynebacterium sp. HMSC071B10]OFP34167.1 signal protein PDZ [Corynebacterium sp. HMSC071B10]
MKKSAEVAQAANDVRSRRWSTVTWGAIPVAALTVLLSLDHIPGTDITLAVPYAAEGPGPMFNALGDVDGEDVIDIEGTETDPVAGNLNMTTVSVRTNMTLLQAIGRWATTDDTIVPISQILPPNLDENELREYNKAEFAASEGNATVAAMRYLGKPTRVIVHDLLEDSPSADALAPGDVLTAVDGTEVTQPSEVQDAVRAHAPGDELTVEISRGDQTKEVRITLGENPHEKGEPMMGILMTSEPAGDVTVNYNLNDVGGPSAGMIFSLAVIDKLSPGQLNHGKFVAGTGTIAESGEVGPIGGITHKLAGARDAGVELFLAPEGNCDAVRTVDTGDMTVASVKNLDEAVAAMDDYAAGRSVHACR